MMICICAGDSKANTAVVGGAIGAGVFVVVLLVIISILITAFCYMKGRKNGKH